MSLKAFSVLLKAPVLTYVRDSPASTLLPLPPLGPRIFVPPHFCLKAFSLCEGLSIAFLSNSSQRGGRFICEPEQHGTVAGGGCEKATMGLRLTSPLPPPPPQPPIHQTCTRKGGISHQAMQDCSPTVGLSLKPSSFHWVALRSPGLCFSWAASALSPGSSCLNALCCPGPKMGLLA